MIKMLAAACLEELFSNGAAEEEQQLSKRTPVPLRTDEIAFAGAQVVSMLIS